MAWTTPKTDWATGELVTAGDMNAIGENLAALQHPATAAYTTTADILRNAPQFADIDTNNLNLTITTVGGDVLVHFHGAVDLANERRVHFDVEVDGTRQGGDLGIVHGLPNGARLYTTFSFTRLIQNLNPGSHTFKLQWKSSGTVRLWTNAQFWVREI